MSAGIRNVLNGKGIWLPYSLLCICSLVKIETDDGNVRMLYNNTKNKKVHGAGFIYSAMHFFFLLTVVL